MNQLGIKSPLHLRLVTEAALLGAFQERDTHPSLIILSDDAGQFNILKHALFWIHAERQIKKLELINWIIACDLEQVNGEFWDLYEKIVAFKKNSTVEAIPSLIPNNQNLFVKAHEVQSLSVIQNPTKINSLGDDSQSIRTSLFDPL